MIKTERARSEAVLVLDAGNALYATYGPVQATGGQVAIEAMNMMGYDAITLGDQDLILGASVLRQRMAEATFAVLSANVIDATTDQPLALPYVIKEIAGRRVGIIGLTRLSTPLAPNPNDSTLLRVDDPLEAVMRYAPEVAELADIVILLSHVGLPMDRMISAEVPEIDIIIGGQSRNVIAPTREGEGGAVIAQAGYRGEWLGTLTARFDAQGELIDFEGETVALTDEYKDDRDMAKFVERIK